MDVDTAFSAAGLAARPCLRIASSSNACFSTHGETFLLRTASALVVVRSHLTSSGRRDHAGALLVQHGDDPARREYVAGDWS